MCMGGCGGKKAAAGTSKSSMPKNWGGMKMSKTSSKTKSSGNQMSGFGQPKVRMSFGSRNR